MSSPSEPLSSAEERSRKAVRNKFPVPESNGLHLLVNEQRAKDIWILLLIFRCVNALCVRTFFQPDEYFQSLEPAWQMAFGPDSGAWITWEWHYQLRSSLHPALFAIIYYVFDNIMAFLQFYPQFRALILAVLPNLVQAYFAAVGDFYTWQLSEKIYGIGSNSAWATLVITTLSPWQWFCSTRTFSNCIETTMTITALNFWPWRISSDSVLGLGSNERETLSSPSLDVEVFVKNLRISLLLAATACILRPTNALIWFCVLMPVVINFSTTSRLTTSDYLLLLREGVLCGLFVLLVSAVSDRVYFKIWTFPPYQWLTFNISQDLAVFYGRNDWHYYLSQGLPLLLTTYLPFTLVALWKTSSLPSSNILFIFTTTILVTLSTLSWISHKEVRFIYPLVPLLHIITAPTISGLFLETTQSTPPAPSITSKPNNTPRSKPAPTTRTTLKNKPFFLLLLNLNIFISIYTTQYHQSGVLSINPFLRHEYEQTTLTNRGLPLPHIKPTNRPFAAFLTPCHSTPWRSQFFHANLTAWALSCEPPIHLLPHTPERENYRDEADRFYDDPVKFLKTEMGTEERPWPPMYVVGFEGIEGVLREYFDHEKGGKWGIRERWRKWNSHWHDDWRRVGDVVIWRVFERGVDEQEGV